MTFHRGYSEYDEDVALHRFLTLSDANRKARRAFLYAAVIFSALGFAAGKAVGETISISGTMVSLEPADAPAVAVVTMHNVSLNGNHDNGSYWLTMTGMTVEVVFTWEALPDGSDGIRVHPPEGFTCEPESCSMTVREMEIGVVQLFDWRGF